MLWMVSTMPCLFKSFLPYACWWSLYSFCFGLSCQAQYICGVVQGGSLAGFGVLPARLFVQVDPGSAFPLRAMHTDFMCQNSGPLDALLYCTYQSDRNPTLDIYARPRVEFLPLCCKADGCTFQGSYHLHTQYPIIWKLFIVLKV